MAFNYRSGSLSSLGHLASEKMHGFEHQAMEQATDYLRRGRQTVRHSAQNLGHAIEEQPVRSALTVIGVACLICAALIRR